MNIIWNQNPLATVVELDDRDRRMLRLAIEADNLRELIGQAMLHLEHGEHEQAKARLAESDRDDAWLDERVALFEADLRGVHCGDCTCVPCSCSKCWAEEYVATDTLVGIDKYELYKVNAAFGKDGARTIDEAIACLAGYNPTPWPDKREIWDAHIDRWREEAKHAHAWLVAYRDLHFPEVR